MPWESTTVTEERIRFLMAYQSEVLTEKKSMAALCHEFGVSRKTGYKAVGRHQAEGWQGLVDRSRAPRSGPHWIAPEVTEVILGIKEENSDFGAKKIRAWLEREDPNVVWPSISAIHQTLKRAGLVSKPAARRRLSHPGAPPPYDAREPNDEWSTDFKGQFRTGDRRYCYPLTIADTYSRFLLGCQSLTRPTIEATWKAFDRVFREYGLPKAIRTDNGTPFAAPALRRLSKLSVRWLRLGIQLRLIQPGKPQQNGRHERMHKTLKARVCATPAANAVEQQPLFDEFRERYNYRRPHESLGQRTPAELYSPSKRPCPSRLPEIEYPSDFEIRRVNANGVMKWHRRELFLSEALIGERVGLQLIEEGLWLLRFADLVLGYYSEIDGKLYAERKPA